MSLDAQRLRTLIRESARHAFDGLRRSHPNESFYAYALYTDDGFATVVEAASTEEEFTRIAQKYGYTKPSNRTARAGVRWSPTEWKYEGIESEYSREVHNYLNGSARDRAETADQCKLFGKKVLGAMVEALRDLDAESFFGSGESRLKTTLFVSISDSNDAEFIEGKSASLLNPPAVVAAFAKRYLVVDESKHAEGPPCPKCGRPLRTAKAQQCFLCGAKWHGQTLV